MCGIVGILHKNGAPVDRTVLAGMCETIRHRGPDHSATFADGGVGLGYVRLSIQDVSTAGNQPMEDESGDFVCVYNGEVYNFPELRAQLETQGVRFRSRTDTEVIVNLFARRGVAGIQLLNGIFGLAIWSKRDRELWLFRDPIGVKPLYYALTPGSLIFASEMKALLERANLGATINIRGLLNYLTYGHAVAPATMVDNVYKLMPGHFLRAKGGEIRLDSYYRFPAPTGHREPKHSVREWAEEAAALLRGVIRRQMISDVPVGVFLSGGLDSSLITALAVERNPALQTFSIGYPDARKYDETTDAILVAKRCGTKHSAVFVEEDDLIAALDRLVYHYDEPFADAAALPVYLLSRFARTQIKVALSGEGGDEMFCGYRRYLAERAASAYGRLPKTLKEAAARVAARFARARALNRIVGTLAIDGSAERYAGWMEVFSRRDLNAILNPELAGFHDAFDGAEVYRRLFANCQDCGVLSRVFFADSQTWLPDTYLEKVDKASMAVSLEVRVPLLDLELVRFAARIPEHLRVKGMTTKYLLRKVAKPLLPAATIRKPKHGLAVPIGSWIRGRLKPYVFDVLLDPASASRQFFRTPAVEDLLRRHISRTENCESKIWSLLILELWMRRHGGGCEAPAIQAVGEIA